MSSENRDQHWLVPITVAVLGAIGVIVAARIEADRQDVRDRAASSADLPSAEDMSAIVPTATRLTLGDDGAGSTASSDLSTSQPAPTSQMLESSSVNALRQFEEGKREFETEKLAEAVAHFDLALQADPTMIVARGYRGVSYYKLGQIEKAVDDLNGALEGTSILRAWFFAHRCMAYRDIEQLDLALADAQSVLEIQPNDAWSLALLGDVYERRKEYQLALQALNRSIELESGSGWAQYLRGKLYGILGDEDKSIADCRRAVDLGYSFAAGCAGSP